MVAPYLAIFPAILGRVCALSVFLKNFAKVTKRSTSFDALILTGSLVYISKTILYALMHTPVEALS